MSRKWMPLWVFPAILILAVVTVWLRLSIVRTTYAINQAEQKTRELQQAREEMQLKVTALRSPRRLEHLAKGRFGLDRPRADQVIHIGAHHAR